jgi:hypothetical protein
VRGRDGLSGGVGDLLDVPLAQALVDREGEHLVAQGLHLGETRAVEQRMRHRPDLDGADTAFL